MPIREQVGPTRVRSPDGTPIAVWRSGRGPPLLLVHGMVADHSTTWQRVRPLLEERFTVHILDRRGRGESGDGPEYALEREAEDVASVVDAIGKPTYLVGHSFGGLVTLEATRHTSCIARLASYEGIPLRGTDAVPDGVTGALQGMLREGEGHLAMYTAPERFVRALEDCGSRSS